MTPGRFLLDRRAGKPDAQGNYTAAPIIDVGLEPCPTITGAAFGRGVWKLTDIALRGGNRPGSTVRTLDEPAPTLVMGARLNDVRWIVGEEEVAAAKRQAQERRRDTP